MSQESCQSTDTPSLRWPLSIQHTKIEHDDDGGGLEEVSVIGCPLGISPTPLVLRRVALPILGLLTGANSVAEIVSQVSATGIDSSMVSEVITLLDQYLFLDNERYRRAAFEVKRVYASLRERAPAFAGGIYPAEPLEAKQFFAGLLEQGNGERATPGQLEVLVAPHIDYRRGGSCYGRIYPEIANMDADMCVLLGTAHQYSPHLFHLTKKHFRTPLGVARCDEKFISEVARRYGEQRSFADELLHKGEHSLELQIPFLTQLKPMMEIAPILVGSFHDFVLAGREPKEFDEYNDFISSLVESIRAYRRSGKRLCFVAGVDMAHVGREFGDDWELTDEKVQEISVRDAEYLECVKQHDTRGLFEHIASDTDARRMCGFPSLYLIMDVLERLGVVYQVESTFYEKSIDQSAGCCVTYAGISLYS